MSKSLLSFVLVLSLSGFCHNPAFAQQQTASRSNLATGSIVASSGQTAQSDSATGDILPPDFRGEITYYGNYSGSVKTRADRMRNLSLGEALRSATSSQKLPLNGEYEITIRYDGNQITGTWASRSATGPNGASLDPRGTITGTRRGSTCTFNDPSAVGGPPGVAYCGRSRWEWANDNVFNPQGHKVALRVVTSQTRFVDYAEQDRIRAIEAEKARVAAAEAAARYAALPNAGAALTRKFDELVQIDSRGWAFNRYSAGSMRNVKIVSGKAGSGTYVMRGEYTYNGNQSGWVMAEMNGQNLSCIQFWDSMIGCRGLRTPEQGQAMRSAMFDLLSPSSGTSSPPSGSTCDETCHDLIQRQARERQASEYGLPPPPG